MNGMNLSDETLLRFEETIRHFRGYIDKERLADDITYLQDFLRDIGALETTNNLSDKETSSAQKAA